MITPGQHSFIFVRLELQECQKVVAIIKGLSQKEQEKHDLDWWTKEEKRLTDLMFELQVLEGIEA